MTALTTRLGRCARAAGNICSSRYPRPHCARRFESFFHVEHEPEKDASPFETSLRVWIAQHYTEDITLDDAAESMGMSTFYFSRQVKVLTGHTFLEYLTAYRIDKAKDLLQSTDMSVSDIGHSAGYSESNYFLRVFKRVTGMTPSTYRNQVKDEGK